ncbi:MAG: M23 family metallopeptidase, partial [Bdellovibrionales bacterium]|nr:M23 family metallopeptidase [Bdellovibrionales bacterium]
IAWPTQVKAGSPIIVDAIDGYEPPLLGSDRLSYFKDLHRWFGVVGLNQKDGVQITGFLPRYREYGEGWWRSPKLEFYQHHISVDRKAEHNAGHLKIPTGVWRKLAEVSPDKKSEEEQIAQEIYASTEVDGHLHCPMKPVENIVTSKFGFPRRLPNNRLYFHTGLDLRARKGTPIRSMGKGLVRFVGKMNVPGNNVIIDHGQGLFSRYMHLSQFEVKTGQMVNRGDIVGLSGSTGRVEAPHLHWEVIWKVHLASPLALLHLWEPLCDQG